MPRLVKSFQASGFVAAVARCWMIMSGPSGAWNRDAFDAGALTFARRQQRERHRAQRATRIHLAIRIDVDFDQRRLQRPPIHLPVPLRPLCVLRRRLRRGRERGVDHLQRPERTAAAAPAG